MWELTVTFICSGEVVGSRRTSYPPVVGDVLELGGNPEHPVLYEVLGRRWRVSPSESQTLLDVEVKRRRSK